MKNQLILFILSTIIITLILWSCDKGLTPVGTSSNIQPEITGISGTVYFKNWPPLDSLKDLRLIVFKNFPPSSVISEILSGQAFLYPALGDTNRLPFYVDSINYEMELDPGTYEYFVVGQQFGDDLYNDWLAAGQYDTTPQDSLPTSLTITENELLKDIFIHVNFDSLPIQPF